MSDNFPCCSSNQTTVVALASQEALASQIQNLTSTLLGTFAKTTTNGRSVWGAQCSPSNPGLACFPQQTGEGLICYLLRLMGTLGTYFAGTWVNSKAYCQNTIVVENGIAYLSTQNAAIGVDPATNPSVWSVVLTGSAGPQGSPGPAGSGSAINFAERTVASNVTLGSTDAVVFCEPAAPFNVTLPSIASSLDGKWFYVWTTGVAVVTLLPNGTDTINGASSYVLDTPNESVLLVSNHAGKWRLL